MPVRFDLSALFRRRSAKFVLALIVAVVAITVVIFTARVRRSKNDSAARQDSVASQPTATPVAKGFVRRARLRPQLRGALNTLGDRLERPGKERLTLVGTLKRQGGSSVIPFRLITEFPGLMRLEEQSGPQSRVIGFNGTTGWTIGSAFSAPDQDAIETFLFDSADRFFLGQMQGLATRYLGPRFRLDDGSAAEYTGPFYDIYQVFDRIDIGTESRQQSKLFYINSDTQTLERVRYQITRDGAPVSVETQITGRRRINGQHMPNSIIRLENGQPVLTLTVASVVINQRVTDNIFNP